MAPVKNGIVALYSIIERYKLNTPAPYMLGNIISAANTFLFKDWVFIAHLFIVIFLDTILGIAVALKNKKFSSWGFGKVFSKICVYFIALVATHNASSYFSVNGADFFMKIFDSTVYAAIMVREYLSLIEKMPQLGIWNPPSWLFKRLQIWYDTGKDEAPKQTGGQENQPEPPKPQS